MNEENAYKIVQKTETGQKIVEISCLEVYIGDSDGIQREGNGM